MLLLHGFPQSSREWAPVMAALADRAHVIAPDLRGAGQTDSPVHGIRRQTRVARDVIALIGRARASSASTSSPTTGAPSSASICVLDHPDRIRRYVAVAVPPPYLRMSPALMAGMMKAMPHLWFQWAIATPGL